MNRFTKALVFFVITFHVAIFVTEAFLWMRPAIYTFALQRGLNHAVEVDRPLQAMVLKSLFINQGFYNLFLAIAGIVGLIFLGRGSILIGKTLLNYMCLSAVGAGLVLALSTTAYIGAFFQVVPAAVALVTMSRINSSVTASKTNS